MVKGSQHFNPDPDVETIYKAMKGIGKWGPWPCPGSTLTLWNLPTLLKIPLLTSLRIA